jgi:(p)ppGpp synthase/HD superfamily hydrolase
MLDQRIADKFGTEVLETVLAVTNRQVDEEGIELSSEERKDDYLARLAAASTSARWVCAADKIHNGSSILADLKRTLDPDTVWSRFAVGRVGTVRWYRRVYERLREVGFDAPIMGELRDVAEQLEKSGR